MRLLDAIEETRLGRVVDGRIKATVASESLGGPTAFMDPDAPWQWRYEIRLTCVQTGPAKAREHLHHRAVHLLAREAFGEIEDDLLELLHMLWEEGVYRAADDPIMTKLETMRRKVRGDTI